jgi:hypothetical protein
LNAARQTDGGVALHHEVDVIGLHAELQHPEGVMRRPPHGQAKVIEHPIRSQAAELSRRSKRDMHRAARIVERAATMGHARTPRAGFSTGSAPAATPGPERQCELMGPATHLDSASIAFC